MISYFSFLIPIYELNFLQYFNISLQQRIMRNNEDIEDEFYDGEDTARRAYVREDEPEQNVESTQNGKERKKYGSMVVLYDGKFVLTLGPDYWCFLPTFTIFCVLSILTIQFVFASSTNVYLQIATVIVCVGTCLSYLMVGISNPGIVFQEESNNQSSNEGEGQSNEKIESRPSKTKKCRRCNLIVSRTTYHCSDCDVCIRQYDHHCPWTSKCIGGGNLVRFYIFLAMVPTYIIYSFMVFGIVMSQLAMEQAATQIQKHTF